MTGGVSSRVWKVDSGERTFCVKQPLDELTVDAGWYAPLERSRYEARWNQTANGIAPGSAPRVHYHDAERMVLVMDYLDPGRFQWWKSKLRDGGADCCDAMQIGDLLVRIHSAAAASPSVVERFPPNDIFRIMRLEPYFTTTAARHPDLAAHLDALHRRTARTRLTMIHGDASPKNILIGPAGPVLLDAECACIGDPAFEIAFCLNHLLLKCLWRPDVTPGYMACFEAMADAYLAGVDWEERDALEARAADLLPALLLARVDGRSPVEYITDEPDRDRVRRCARGLIARRPSRLEAVRRAWERELKR